MNELNVKLDIFEGPLDLLLHLIKTLEIDIYDIPIAKITEQYMVSINSMKELNLEVAGEYIVMAATLMAIKSKTLIPKVEKAMEESDYVEQDDPREELVAKLIEYRKYKYAADVLKEKEKERSQYFTKDASNLDEFKDKIEPLEPNAFTTIDLFMTFSDIINRQKKSEPVITSVSTEVFSIEDKISEIMKQLNGLNHKNGILFHSLFYAYTRNEIVTTFMALLELIKSGELVARQKNRNEPIVLYLK